MAISMDSTQNKLLLLFVFDKMEMPLSEQTILEMCCSANNWINYIDCKQALMQLIDANFVAAVNKGASNEAMYSIYAGRQNLSCTFFRAHSLQPARGCKRQRQTEQDELQTQTGIRKRLSKKSRRHLRRAS